MDIPVEGTDWQIGLIVGPSGAGKTTIGRRLFPEALFHTGYQWPETAAVVDGFPAGLEGREITAALSSVGFSSPPHWLKRYAHLSNGQKFRCKLARLMLQDAELVVFDEFTSVVDRDAAKVSSATPSANWLRRVGPQRAGHFGLRAGRGDRSRQRSLSGNFGFKPGISAPAVAFRGCSSGLAPLGRGA